MKRLIYNIFNRGINTYYKLGAIVTMTMMSIPVFADIPSAPNINGGSTSDYMKTGQSVFNEIAGISITALYVMTILIYCAGTLWLLSQAKKTKEWGNFFKGAGIGLAVLVLVLILLNQAKSAIGS